MYIRLREIKKLLTINNNYSYELIVLGRETSTQIWFGSIKDDKRMNSNFSDEKLLDHGSSSL